MPPNCRRLCKTGRKQTGLAGLIAALVLLLPDTGATAATLTSRDATIIAKAIGFLDPAPSGGVVAVVFDAANPASRQDADLIVGLFTGGLAEGGSSVTAKAVDSASLGNGSGYIAVIAAASAASGTIMAAAKAQKIPCISGDPAPVRSGQCMMAVSSEPKVDITVNHAAAAGAGVNFQSAFQMLIHEI